jgi:LPS-assembly lipoprotein
MVATRLSARILLLLLVAALQSSCGFQLQGRVPLSSALTITLIEADDLQSDFVQDLRKALLTSGARLAGSPEEATAVIRVERDELLERILSVSARNIPREYELTYTVRIAVSSGERTLLPAEEFSLSRDFSFDERALLAKEREKDALSEALARDLVGILMRRLSGL